MTIGGHGPNGCGSGPGGSGVEGPSGAWRGDDSRDWDDSKRPNHWIVRITDGATGASFVVTTGPNGERTRAIIPLTRGACHEVGMDFGGFVQDSGHFAYFLGLAPVDRCADPNNPDPAPCPDCCCVQLASNDSPDQPSGTLLGNHCSFNPDGRSARVCLVKVELLMDSNRDGTIDTLSTSPDRLTGSDRARWQSGTASDGGIGAVIMYNCDKDSAHAIPREVDADDATINGPNDLQDLARLKVRVSGVPAGSRVQVVSGQAAALRLFDDLTDGATGSDLPATLDIADGQWHELGVEGKSFPGVAIGGALCPERVTISAIAVDNTGGQIAGCGIDLRAARIAPWLMTTHIDTVTTVYVSHHPSHSNNPLRGTDGLPVAPDFHARVAAAVAGTGAIVQVINSGDPWPQDQFEIGFTSMPGKVLPVAMNSPRRRELVPVPLDEFVEATLTGPGMGLLKSLTNTQHTQNSFGNLECLPAYGGATGRKLGEVYHGDQLSPPIPDFLQAQPQQPWDFNTSWLSVEHVDENMTVRPTGDGNFNIVLACPRIAIEILQARPDDVIKRWAMGPPNNPEVTDRTASQILAQLLLKNEDYQRELDLLRTALQGRGFVVEEVPVLFNQDGVALLPDMVNLLCVNGKLIVPKPFYQPFEDAFREAVGLATPVEFIDCLERHWGVGQAHCGTNTRRTPRPEWERWWEIVP